MNTTSLMQLDTILREICAFIIGFSCTVWTKMGSLAGSLAYSVLADAIIISTCPLLPPTNIWKGGVVQKVRKNNSILLVNVRKEM